MSRGRCVFLFGLAACGHGVGADDSPPVPAVVRAPDPIAPGAPHGGAIIITAITEQGDAALTADNIGTLRLWPTLDGRRPPVPIAAVAPADLSLGHAGDDLVAGILDEAGTVRVLRLGRDGTIRKRAQLPAEPTIQQLVGVDGGVIVRRSDQTIERYDANGQKVGSLVPEAGERIVGLAARGGSVLAQVSSEERPWRQLRWIILDENMRWGTSLMLPTPYVPGSLAISPDHVRVAVREMSGVAIFEVVPSVRRVASITFSNVVDPPIGFTDGEHFVAIDGDSHSWWSAKQGNDPWAPLQVQKTSLSQDGAIGNGIVISGMGSVLAIDDGSHVKYLGWNHIANGMLQSTAEGTLYVVSGSEITWLGERSDGQLEEKRSVDISTLLAENPNATPIDDQHVVVQQYKNDGGYTAELVDVNDPKAPRIALGADEMYGLVQWQPATHTLMLGRNSIRRWRIDFAKHEAIALAPLAVGTGATSVIALDPARAHGAIALTQGYEGGNYQVYAYQDEPGAPADKPLVAKTSWVLTGALVASDAEGTTYVAVDATTPLMRISVSGKREQTKISPGAVYAATVTHDGSLIAIVGKSSVRLFETATGKQRWEAPEWATAELAFTRDDKKLVLRAANGQIVIDTATGKRIATTCGWDFGLHDKVPTAATFGMPTACED
jgi:hypothetical protein